MYDRITELIEYASLITLVLVTVLVPVVLFGMAYWVLTVAPRTSAW